jgi:lysozyme family protein
VKHFENVVKEVLDREGGFTVDHAGPTNFGITQPFLNKYGKGKVKDLTVEKAKEAYYAYWLELNMDNIIDYQESLKIFDTCVWHGAPQCVKHVQRALIVCGEDLKIDGKLGPVTFEAINSVNSDIFLAALKSQIESFIRHLVEKKPEHKKYLKGWLKRALL